jgi:hypothetical protein
MMLYIYIYKHIVNIVCLILILKRLIMVEGGTLNL